MHSARAVSPSTGRATAVSRSLARAVATTAWLSAAAGLAPVAAQKGPAPAPAPAAPTFVGIWYDDTGEGAVEILPCGEHLCGRIVWLKNPLDNKTGRPHIDDLNPQSARRNRPICGLQIIGDLKLQSSGSWDAGWIYDPKVGKSYDVEIKLRSPDRLIVTGYLGTKFLSESYTWTRAPANLKRCDAV